VRKKDILSTPEDQRLEPPLLGTQVEPPAPGPAEPSLTLDLPSVPPPPPRDPVWSGWDVFVIALLAVLSIPVFGVVLVVGMHFATPHINLNDVAATVAVLAQLLGYIVVAIYMVMLLEGKYGTRFWKAIRWNWPSSIWKSVGLGVVLLLSLNVLAHFLPMPKSTPFDQFFSKPRDAYLLSAFAITLGPLMEELFFRGFLYPVLKRRLGMVWGIILTALPFGLMHMFQYGYAWGVVLVIFIMGVVCTVVREVTGSVASSFLVHVGYNATEMLLFAVATDGFRHMEKAGVLFKT
jgi:membrane protease YdiL (CAAX protease family)